MRTVGVRALKNGLSRYLRIAASGEIVQVTDRGRAIAELSPPRAEPSAMSAEEHMAELVRLGLVTEPKRRLTGPPPKAPPLVPLDVLLRDLDESRSDR